MSTRGSASSGLELGAVESVGDRLRQLLPGPPGGEMDVDTARGLADTGADFEETGAQGFDLNRAPGLG
jgi:hypothetical protein